MAGRKKIGLLTGGGDCPGLNAVIRAVTKGLILQSGAEVFGFLDGFLGLIEKRYRKLDYRDVSGILTLGGTILGTSNRANPFKHFDADNADVSDEVIDYVNLLGIDGIVAIGAFDRAEPPACDDSRDYGAVRGMDRTPLRNRVGIRRHPDSGN